MRSRFWRDIQVHHGETIGAFLRFIILAAGAAFVIVTIGEAIRNHDPDNSTSDEAAISDPLATSLKRCRDVTAEQLAVDDTCRRIWAENRKRFFTRLKPAETC